MTHQAPTDLGRNVPFPPFELANRVGAIKDHPDPWGHFTAVGRLSRDAILAAMPAGWRLDGKRVLDFGCGVGRTLRHFLADAGRNEFWGCDIDQASIAWLEAHLSPPFRFVVNRPEPPIALPSGTFDLIYCISVFTHLTDTWSAWLLELHRLLASDGLLFATFMGPALAETFTGETGDEDRIGMNVLRYDAPWDEGGPMVLHSPWWIRAHWGRAFEIVSIEPSGFARNAAWAGHGTVVLRKRDVQITVDELEALEPGEPREAAALAANRREQFQEIRVMRTALAQRAQEVEACARDLDAVRARLQDLERRHQQVIASKSWHLTRPLRDVAAQLRARR